MAIRLKYGDKWIIVGNNFEIDKTLTKSGSAADAAITGAMIEELRNEYKVAGINFSNWDNGSFVISYIDGFTSTFQVEFDEQDRPNRIVNEMGDEITIQW